MRNGLTNERGLKINDITIILILITKYENSWVKSRIQLIKFAINIAIVVDEGYSQWA